MSENTTPSRQPLLRDRNQKIVAGVCTGLGHHLDIDPVVFRILFAVLTLFAGLGILAYAACWLLIPAAGEGSSEAQRLLTGPNVYVAAVAAALMVLGLLWFTSILADQFDHSLPILLAVAAAIGVVLWRRENHGGPGSPDSRRDGAAGGGTIPGGQFNQGQTWWQRPVQDNPQTPAGEERAPEAGKAEIGIAGIGTAKADEAGVGNAGAGEELPAAAAQPFAPEPDEDARSGMGSISAQSGGEESGRAEAAAAGQSVPQATTAAPGEPKSGEDGPSDTKPLSA